MLHKLITAGVSVFRLNFSHGDLDDKAKRINRIRTISTGVSRPIAILVDLQGPKIRVGVFKDGGIELRSGDVVTVTSYQVAGGKRGQIESA